MKRPDDATVTGVATGTGEEGQAPETERPLPEWTRYERLEFIGRGGMGRVFRAWDPRLKRWVALKFVELQVDKAAERFLCEARAQASLSHPNVCEVFEVGEVAGQPYIAMQLIDGPSLGAAARELGLRDRVAAVRDVALAVHAAHEQGLIHRDIKPSNVMLDQRGGDSWVVKVVDFGLSRSLDQPRPEETADAADSRRGEGLTQLGAIAGTPAYMAPEQALGANDRLDARTDVYAIGCTLYEILAGQPPFTGGARPELLLRVLAEAPKPLRAHDAAIPADLEAIVLKCLAKEPSRRYGSARALAEDLKRFLAGDPVGAFPSSPGYRLRKAVTKHRALFAVAGLAVAALLVVGGIWLRTLWQANRQAELAMRFGLQVDRVESSLWRVRSLPLHDVRPARGRVVGMLDDIRRDMDELGPPADGPGNVALGRGYLALGQYEQARHHLARAWSSGYRPPEAAYALGLTLGQLYQQALDDARRAAGGAERERRRQEAERTLRDPALALLRELPESAIEAPEYVEALIARHEGRLDDALRAAREAADRVEWLHEAHVLQGEVLVAMADEQRDGGHYDRAQQLLESADAAYNQAIAIAASDVRAYQGQCSMWFSAWHTEVVHRRRADPATFDRLVASCSNGLEVNRDMPRLHELLALAHSILADAQVARRQDPADAVVRAVEEADAALALDPASIFALTSKTTALWHRGQYQMMHNVDPSETFAAAVAAAEQALRIDPRSSRGHATLGIVLIDQAIWNQAKGLDPRPWLQRSIDASLTAAEIDPDTSGHLVNAAIAYRRWMEYRVHTLDEDPRGLATRALAIVARALAINPEFWWAYRVEGAFHTLVAEWMSQHEEDPGLEVEVAVASLERALELNPGNSRALAYLGRAHVALATFQLADGRSPAAALEAADEIWRAGAARSPANGDLAELRRRIDECR